MVSSEFISKIEFACKKKESLFTEEEYNAIMDEYEREREKT